MSSRRRAAARLIVMVGLFVALGSMAASPASAHPLGNATVNHYDGLHLYPDHLTDFAVEDVAEIPTLQRKPEIDTNGDGTLSVTERSAYGARQCASLAAADRIAVNHLRVALAVTNSSYIERPGAIGLSVGRLVCQLSGRVALTRPAQVAVADNWDGAGIGWHEITAVGTDVSLRDSPFPATSISRTLLAYPNDLLSSPLDVRSGTLTTQPGAGASTYAATHNLPVAGTAVRALNTLATAFNNLVGTKHLTVGVGLLAILLAVTLGAGHALLPGHGKTIMATYLVGRRGRLRDVVTVGATVTLTHTLGVLILGLAISLSAAFAPTAVEQDLAILSGLVIVGVGVGLLATSLRRLTRSHPAGALTTETSATAASSEPVDGVRVPTLGSQPPLDASIDLGLASAIDTLERTAQEMVIRAEPHPHHHDLGHPGLNHQHPHLDPHPATTHVGPRQPYGRTSLLALGVAGGLVPSPSALLVLLAAIALGRTVFGITLVLGYGLGMATALTAAGLLLVQLRHRLASRPLGRRLAEADRLLAAVPLLTSVLILIVGIGIVLRAVGGSV